MSNSRFLIMLITLVCLIGCGDPGDDPGGYVVSLKLNGGAFPDGGGDVKYGGAYTPTPLKEILEPMVEYPVIQGDKVFAVWNTAPDGSGDDYIMDTIVTKNVTLYAIYGEVVRDRSTFELVECGNPDKIYTLDQDISLVLGSPWEPLCPDEDVPFKGRIYGKGFGISYFATRSSDDEMPDASGLFAYMDGARVMDLAMKQVRVYGRTAAGAVAGVVVDSVIERVDVTGEISGYGYVGGVAGVIKDGTAIRKSSFGDIAEYEEKSVTALGADAAAGGIAGYACDSIVTDSSSNSAVSASSDNSAAGGIVGYLENGETVNCLHSGSVIISGGDHIQAGGIVGAGADSEISHCYSDSVVDASEGTDAAAGGIAGQLDNGDITYSAALGLAVWGTEAARIAGGASASEIDNAYARTDAIVNWATVSDSAREGLGIALTRARKSANFFKNTLGFDFGRSWGLPDYYDYPRLIWEDVPAYTRILTATDLNKVRKNPAGWYVLDKDIDLLEYDADGLIVPWTPLGKNLWAPFTGRFDGNGNTISNMTPARTKDFNHTYAGLFGRVENAVITNLNITVRVEEADEITEEGVTGGLAGYMSGGRIENVHVSGSITGNSAAACGGLVGYMDGTTIIYSSFDGDIESLYKTTYSMYVGGLVGDGEKDSPTDTGDVNIYYSKSTGNLDSSTLNYSQIAGGLAGSLQHGVVVSSYSDMDIHASGGSASRAGGLFGDLKYSSVRDCYSAGDVRASSINYTAPTTPVRLMAGGIAGYADESSVSSSAGFCGSVAAEGENLKVASLETYAARIAGMSDTTSYDNVYGSAEMVLTADDLTGEMGLDVATDAMTPQFYTDTLGWDLEQVWEIPAGSPYPQLLWAD
jgi:hypothetical protein